ncbi:hypothetical protein HPB50_025168 [Hyalomma asiaticum]|uniref:Uncharacterized protein n=1 Tax=Hyalomma asiaticum TaxID=266040 RepID=A0ACB7SBV1_HYAAI|nr:hypothetical protein HPB50_025168 [Hyalomma asiaticum]
MALPPRGGPRNPTQRTEAETGCARARVRLGEGFRKDKGPSGPETERLFVSVHGGAALTELASDGRCRRTRAVAAIRLLPLQALHLPAWRLVRGNGALGVGVRMDGRAIKSASKLPVVRRFGPRFEKSIRQLPPPFALSSSVRHYREGVQGVPLTGDSVTLYILVLLLVNHGDIIYIYPTPMGLRTCPSTS